ncbi:MAG: DNA polymerase III subunit delta [Candidatus Omnitrophica bacterium]|nr:DNA polymerase III subunit delta [Candidatus Omnitrophota bacterium]
MNYLIAGNSDFLKQEALEKIKARLFSKGLHKNNIERFYAEENTLYQALDAARTPPLFSSDRLVIFHDADLTQGAPAEEILRYLKTPQETSTLILVTPDEKISSSLLESLKGLCQVMVLDIPYENQLESWIVQRVNAAGKKIETQGAKLLKELIGSDLRTLIVEIEKLVLFTGERLLITAGDIEQLATDSIHYSGFVLGDAFAAKNLSGALTVFLRLLDERKSVPEVVGLISWQLQRLFQAKQILHQGGSWDEISRGLRISSPFLLRKLQQQLAKWSVSELKEATRTLLLVDTSAKKGEWPPQLALEDWMVSRLL